MSESQRDGKQGWGGRWLIIALVVYLALQVVAAKRGVG